MRRSKFAYLSWLLRYSAFSILTEISWLIFHPRCLISWRWLSIFETICGFGFIHRFQKWYYFWKLTIQQLTNRQNAIWLENELYQNARNFLRIRSLFYYIYGQNFIFQLKNSAVSQKSTLGFVEILAKSRVDEKRKKIFSFDLDLNLGLSGESQVFIPLHYRSQL